MPPRSGIAPDGTFVWGVHAPGYRVRNFRQTESEHPLGFIENRPPMTNAANFPPGDVQVDMEPVAARNDEGSG